MSASLQATRLLKVLQGGLQLRDLRLQLRTVRIANLSLPTGHLLEDLLPLQVEMRHDHVLEDRSRIQDVVTHGERDSSGKEGIVVFLRSVHAIRGAVVALVARLVEVRMLWM